MSDRANTITVVLENQTRVDDLDNTLNAIRMIKGVISAEANVSTIDDFWAVERARHRLTNKIWEVLYPNITKK